MDIFDAGRHPLNIGHFVMGLAFLGLVGVWALIQGDVVGDSGVRWLMPVPWVLAGVAGLLATSLVARRNAGRSGRAGRGGSEDDEPSDR